MRRGYLLPDGCKDLSDAAKLKVKQGKFFSKFWATTIVPTPPAELPPITRQVFIPPRTTVRKLAELLALKPFEIVGDLMKLGMFAMVDEVLAFNTISSVAKMHGFLAIKAG